MEKKPIHPEAKDYTLRCDHCGQEEAFHIGARKLNKTGARKINEKIKAFNKLHQNCHIWPKEEIKIMATKSYIELVKARSMDKITFLRDIKKEDLSDFLSGKDWHNQLGYCIYYADGSYRWVSEKIFKEYYKETDIPDEEE